MENGGKTSLPAVCSPEFIDMILTYLIVASLWPCLHLMVSSDSPPPDRILGGGQAAHCTSSFCVGHRWQEMQTRRRCMIYQERVSRYYLILYDTVCKPLGTVQGLWA